MRYLQQKSEAKIVHLDAKNKKILSLLASNARIPYTKIARMVGLSRDSVSYRISNLEKSGVLQGYRTLVDIQKLGYDAYHLFIRLSQPDKKIEQDLIEKFKNYPFARAVLKFHGKYDYQLALVARNVTEFDSFLSKIMDDCGSYTRDYDTLVLTKTYQALSFPKSFLQIKEEQIKKSQVKAEIDIKDTKILRVLSDNSDLELYKIAKKVNLSPDAVKYRLKNMIASGVIKGFLPVVNYSALGYSIYAVLLRIYSFNEEKEIKLKSFLHMNEHVLWMVKAVGKYNLIAYICVRTTEDLHQTIIQLRDFLPNGIDDYETLIAYEEYKYTYFPDYICL